ncbi:MAG: hypothetical protein ACO20I_06870 [bacterium]
MTIVLAWIMSCSQYHGAIERLYDDPFYKMPEHQEERTEIHEYFKKKTFPECLEVQA